MNGSSAQAERLWLRLALLVFTAGVVAYRDNVMDDTWIHLQYARNLREHGEIAFNSGEPSLGLTSPLWVLLLAALGHTEIVARLASVASGALAVWLFASVARRVLGNVGLAAAATAAWAANVWLVRHAPNGMESTLAVLFVLWAIDLEMRGTGSMWQRLALGVALAAAFLTRPEAGLLVALVALSDLRSADGRRRLLVWLPVCALLCGAWLLFAFRHTGEWIAGTAAAKSGAAWDLTAAARVAWRQARIVGAAHAVEIVGLLASFALALRLDGWRVLRAWSRSGLALYTAFALALVVAFAVRDVQVQPRYLLPILPAVTLLGFVAWRNVAGSGARAAWVLALACVGVNTVVSVARVLPPTRDFAAGLRPAMAQLVQTLEAHADESSRVATPDIGYIGYHASVPVLDLGGLIDPDLLALRQRVGDEALLRDGVFLERGPVDFVVDRSLVPERFAGHVTRALRWQVLQTVSIPNLGLSRPGPYYYTLYALEPDDAPPIGP